MVVQKTHTRTQFNLLKKGTTSGASRRTLFFKKVVPLEVRHKKLVSRSAWKSGRNSSGRRVLRTRAARTRKISNYSINYSFRDLRLSFVAGLVYLPALQKVLSLTFLASGSVCYTTTTTNHRLFRIIKLRSCFWRKAASSSLLLSQNKNFDVVQGWYILNQLPKNQPVCLLEIVPEKGVQYTRAGGSKSVILKMDSRTGTSLVKLSSGVRKIFSIYSVASLGSVALPDKRLSGQANAGGRRRLGRKPMVRGVAKNPVDHPHGGRTKTITNPRTP
jgi:ribosomal protein L2